MERWMRRIRGEVGCVRGERQEDGKLFSKVNEMG